MTSLLLLAALARATTPAMEAEGALDMLASGRPAEAAVLLEPLALRMPHNPRLGFALAAALFADSAAAAADSVLEGLSETSGPLAVPEETLASATTAASLASAISKGDYAGVSACADTLRGLLGRRGDASGFDAANLETALAWLADHQPPQQEGGGGDDSDQQQDEGEDDQRDGDGSQQPPQRPEEDEPADQSRSQNGSDGVPQAPERMTPEMARRILDMVDEAAEGDTVKAGAGGGRLSW